MTGLELVLFVSCVMFVVALTLARGRANYFRTQWHQSSDYAVTSVYENVKLREQVDTLRLENQALQNICQRYLDAADDLHDWTFVRHQEQQS